MKILIILASGDEKQTFKELITCLKTLSFKPSIYIDSEAGLTDNEIQELGTEPYLRLVKKED